MPLIPVNHINNVTQEKNTKEKHKKHRSIRPVNACIKVYKRPTDARRPTTDCGQVRTHVVVLN